MGNSSRTATGGDLKGVPHWRSKGIDVAIGHWRGLFMPAGTPHEAVAFWGERLARLIKTDAWKRTLEQYGSTDAFASSVQFKRELEHECKVTGKLLRELGFAKQHRAQLIPATFNRIR
jgi:tripartite-type tricarboxylate transporter receptor subunit TctC